MKSYQTSQIKLLSSKHCLSSSFFSSTIGVSAGAGTATTRAVTISSNFTPVVSYNEKKLMALLTTIKQQTSICLCLHLYQFLFHTEMFGMFKFYLLIMNIKCLRFSVRQRNIVLVGKTTIKGKENVGKEEKRKQQMGKRRKNRNGGRWRTGFRHRQ